jgi:hypothetical protein
MRMTQLDIRLSGGGPRWECRRGKVEPPDALRKIADTFCAVVAEFIANAV